MPLRLSCSTSPPPEYVLGQMPSLLQHVRCHLVPGDQRREEFEHIARRLGLNDPHPTETPDRALYDERKCIVDLERGQIVTAMRAASSASLREQVRVRSFRNVLLVTTAVTTMLAIVLAIVGWLYPALIPLCFAPQEAGQAVVVCPTQQSAPFSTTQSSATPAQTSEDIDDAIARTATPWDLLVVELVGLTAAALAATAAIRRLKGSSERYGLPVALAALKLPTGAVTAFLVLLLMRGQFVPGLSALDALTLLVTTLDITDPSLAWQRLRALWDDVGPQFLAFGISFAVIASYWLAHHRLVRMLAAVDQPTIVANLLLIASIVVIPFSTNSVGDPGIEDLPLPTAFLAVNIAIASGLHTLVYVLAYRRELFLIRPSARELHGSLVIGLSPAVIFLASVPVAYLASPVIAQLCWLLIIPIRVAARRWAADSAGGSAS